MGPGQQADSQNFQVDLGGMVELLSRNLYSGPRVFVRELLQNGFDAITARRELELEGSPARIRFITDNQRGVPEYYRYWHWANPRRGGDAAIPQSEGRRNATSLGWLAASFWGSLASVCCRVSWFRWRSRCFPVPPSQMHQRMWCCGRAGRMAPGPCARRCQEEVPAELQGPGTTDMFICCSRSGCWRPGCRKRIKK